MPDHNNHFSRRLFLKASILLLNAKDVFADIVFSKQSQLNNKTAFLYRKELKPFYHGVASGDPLFDRVIIWTRITTDKSIETKINWEVAEDNSFTRIIKKGIITTNERKNFTAKIDVQGLKPDTYYYYRFIYGDAKSVTGRTKTLPIGNIKEVNFIAVNCNSFEGGYFNAYRKISERKEKIDAVLHLGDYIYEDYLPQYIEVQERAPLPGKRCVSLNDYRTRYSQYRLDVNLQAAHQMHPFINIWDDHEIANDAYANGAGGHNPLSDGDYIFRKQNALQAFHEWLPIRNSQPNCNRSFQFGNMVDLFMLDARTERTQVEGTGSIHFNDKERTMISREQFNWLTDGLKESNKRWKIIGNQVIFSRLDNSIIQVPNPDRKIDNWNGYPSQQKEMISFIKSNKINNTVFVSGDSHCSWAFNVPDFSSNQDSERSYAVEVGIPAISSGTWGDKNPADKIREWEEGLLRLNPHLKYTDLSNHGYVHLIITNSNVKTNWYAIDKHKAFTDKETLVKSMVAANNIIVSK